MASLISPQLKRLLAFVRPYKIGLSIGIVFLGIVAVAEGAVTLMIVPIFDRVLAPTSSDSNVVLFKNPFSGRSVYVNHFFPHSIHNVWTVVKLVLIVGFLVSGFVFGARQPISFAPSAIDMTLIQREFGIKLTNIDQFVRAVLGRRMTD